MKNSELPPAPKAINDPVKLIEWDQPFLRIEDYRRDGLPEGISCGWENLDPYFKIKPGQLNIVSGFPSHGKSEFVENIACYLARTMEWNILMYSPENYPSESHAINLLEKIAGKPLLNKNYGVPLMTDEELYEAQYLIEKQFKIISADENPYSFEEILISIEHRIKVKKEKINMVIIDPWNELESKKPKDQTETEYIGYCLMMARRCARRLNISFWIVCHPAKPAKKNNDNSYDPPDMYDLSGSSHWYNKSDCAFIVHRYQLTTTKAHVFIKKIKNRFYGRPGEVFFNFDPHCSRFVPFDDKEDNF